MTAGIVLLGIAIFFAGAAFQEAIMGTDWNYPDGGARSLFYAVVAFVIAYRIIMTVRREKR